MDKTKFPSDLETAKYLAELRAVCFCGLLRDANGVQQTRVWFEICDYETLDILAAFGGFPERYEHYRFAMEYLELSKGYAYGLQKIYEMVINNDPVYAYLLANNSLIDNKLVINHVYGHADFFFNNVYFRRTNRRALEMMANHAKRIAALQEKMTEANKAEVVEQWVDTCISLEDLIDPHSDGIKRTVEDTERLLDKEREEEEDWGGRFAAKDYLDKFINPPEELEKHRAEQTKEKERRARQEKQIAFPTEPAPDIFKFLIDHSPLESWQREIAQIIWEEAVYYVPQGQTKIMNEGWASYWHSHLMTGGGASAAEIIDFADHHSGTMAQPGPRINPYKLGLETWRDIEYRWNTARHGKIWTECDEAAVVNDWDQFVAFKIIFDSCQDNIVEFGRRWHEFLCFWRAVEDERGAFPKDVYAQFNLLALWDDYLSLTDCFTRLSAMKKGALDYIHRLLEKDKNLRRKTKIIRALLRECGRELRKRRLVYKALARIKKEFAAEKLLPKDFLIPQSFFSYAREHANVTLAINEGKKKIFETRRLYCDVTFIEDFLTEELAASLKLFTYDEDENGNLIISSRKFEEVKQRLLEQLTNWGRPQMMVVDANWQNGRKLLLRHKFDGRELRLDWAEETMRRLHRFWHRPVFVETLIAEDEKEPVKFYLSFNGKEFTKQKAKD